MNYFGCRDDFAIEIGTTIDHRRHCQLDFYARGIHLNRADNQAYYDCAVAGWPLYLFDSDSWRGADIYWEVPFSTPVEVLLERVLADNGLYHKHLEFRLGPVTDSFSLLVFGRPTDFVLLFIRNDGWGTDTSDLGLWNRLELDGQDPSHWFSITMPRTEFGHLCKTAHACFVALGSTRREAQKE